MLLLSQLTIQFKEISVYSYAVDILLSFYLLKSITRRKRMPQDEKKTPVQHTEEKKHQYHPQFANSLYLELRENKNDLEFNEEYVLNTGPLSIDLLIIKKNNNAVIKSGLGALFKKENIWEYKSPGDKLNYKTFNKGLAYLHLYIATSPDNLGIMDVTVTFLRHSKPIQLFKKLSELGYQVTEFEPGIYHIKMHGQPDIQIIVSKELDDRYEWVKALNDNISHDKIISLISDGKKLEETDQDYASKILEFVLEINENRFEEENKMGIITELFEAEKKIRLKDEQLQSKDAEIASVKKELESQKEETANLKKRIKQLEKKLSSVAML